MTMSKKARWLNNNFKIGARLARAPKNMSKDDKIDLQKKVREINPGLLRYKEDNERKWHTKNLPDDFSISEMYAKHGPVAKEEDSALFIQMGAYRDLMRVIADSDDEETPEIWIGLFSDIMADVDNNPVELCSICIASEDGIDVSEYSKSVMDRADDILARFGIPKQSISTNRIL